MEIDNPNYKIMAAAAVGALGGFLLAGYLGNAKYKDRPLSEHLAALSRLIEQFEGSDSDGADNIKERIERLLTTIEESYGNTEE